MTRPSLGKKVFPVCRVAQKNASREVGMFFFLFPNFNIYKLECTGGGGGLQKLSFYKIWRKKSKPKANQAKITVVYP